MTQEQNLVYVQGRLLQAAIHMHAMVAENTMCQLRGTSPAYGEDQFLQLIDEYGVHHNALVRDLTS